MHDEFTAVCFIALNVDSTLCPIMLKLKLSRIHNIMYYRLLILINPLAQIIFGERRVYTYMYAIWREISMDLHQKVNNYRFSND